MEDSVLITIIEIFIACVLAEVFVMGTVALGRHLWNKYFWNLDINCDNTGCQKPLPLRRTPDKKAYLCKSCMKAYLAEHEGEFTPEQVRLALRSYRRLRRKRGKK